MDRPERVSGHYAANLVGSGLGAAASVLLMYVFSTRGCLLTAAVAAYLAGVLVAPWSSWGTRRAVAPEARTTAFTTVAVGAGLALAAFFAPLEPAVSQYKMLSLVREMPGTKANAMKNNNKGPN